MTNMAAHILTHMIEYYYLLQINLTRAYPNPLIHGFIAYGFVA